MDYGPGGTVQKEFSITQQKKSTVKNCWPSVDKETTFLLEEKHFQWCTASLNTNNMVHTKVYQNISMSPSLGFQVWKYPWLYEKNNQRLVLYMKYCTAMRPKTFSRWENEIMSSLWSKKEPPEPKTWQINSMQQCLENRSAFAEVGEEPLRGGSCKLKQRGI